MPETLDALRRANPRAEAGFDEAVEAVSRAVRAQLGKLAHSTMLGLTHPLAAELAGRLVQIAPALALFRIEDPPEVGVDGLGIIDDEDSPLARGVAHTAS